MTLLAGGEQVEVEGGMTLRILSTWELMAVRQEGQGQVLLGNACLLARALERDGVPVFPHGRAVLEALTPGEIEGLCRRWGALMARENPSALEDEGRILALKESLSRSSYGRLQWRVLRAFGALPTEARARKMTHRDYLWCGLNLMLDDEEVLDALCPTCRSGVEEGRCPACGGVRDGNQAGRNGDFDWERFEKLRRGEKV